MAKSNDDFGKPLEYNPEFKGPLGKRSCTDILCLLIFVIFIGCWIGVSIFAFLNGDINKLTTPKDSLGRKCGVDAEVLHKKYLLFFDLSKCASPSVPLLGCPTQQMCVEECPKEVFIYEKDKHKSFEELKKLLYCTIDKNSLRNKADIDKAILEEKCAKWYLTSTPLFNRCIYNFLPMKEELPVMNSDFQLYIEKHVKIILSWVVLTAQNIVAKFVTDENYKQVSNKVVEDLAGSSLHIFIGLLIATVTCILFIILMQWIASIMVWLSIVGVIGLLALSTYICSKNYIFYKNRNQPDFVLLKKDSYTENKDVWLVLLILSSILLGISILMIIFLRKRIVIAIALIREASKAIGSVKSTLFFPIFPWIIQIGVLAFTVFVGIYLSSVMVYKINEDCTCADNSKSYQQNSFCNPKDFTSESCKNCGQFCQEHPDKKSYIQIFHAINVIGFLWGEFFISGLGEMILAATFATWYWIINKKDVPFFTLTLSAGRTLRYNLGTVAFGALIITICRMIRIVLEYIDQKLKKTEMKIFTYILCLCKCCFWCLEKFLRFINRNAYIMCAVHGKNFCTSAKDAFNLLMRNVVRVVVLDKVTDFLFFLGKLMITAGTGCVAYYAFTERKKDIYLDENLHYEMAPVIVIVIGSYIICSIFFSVYEMAVDTLFLCFLEDSERNDGSKEKPYFMSKQLRKILGKKNE